MIGTLAEPTLIRLSCFACMVLMSVQHGPSMLALKHGCCAQERLASVGDQEAGRSQQDFSTVAQKASTWTSKVCKTVLNLATYSGFGPLF